MNTSERLKIARAERKAAQRELKEIRLIEMEKEAAYQAGLELARMKLTPEQRKDILDRAEKRFDSKYQMGHGNA
jgi:ribosomal protein L18